MPPLRKLTVYKQQDTDWAYDCAKDCGLPGNYGEGRRTRWRRQCGVYRHPTGWRAATREAIAAPKWRGVYS